MFLGVRGIPHVLRAPPDAFSPVRPSRPAIGAHPSAAASLPLAARSVRRHVSNGRAAPTRPTVRMKARLRPDGAVSRKASRRRHNVELLTTFGDLITMEHVNANSFTHNGLSGEKELVVSGLARGVLGAYPFGLKSAERVRRALSNFLGHDGREFCTDRAPDFGSAVRDFPGDLTHSQDQHPGGSADEWHSGVPRQAGHTGYQGPFCSCTPDCRMFGGPKQPGATQLCTTSLTMAGSRVALRKRHAF